MTPYDWKLANECDHTVWSKKKVNEKFTRKKTAQLVERALDSNEFDMKEYSLFLSFSRPKRDCWSTNWQVKDFDSNYALSGYTPAWGF